MKNPVLNLESFLADTRDMSYFTLNSDEYKVLNDDMSHNEVLDGVMSHNKVSNEFILPCLKINKDSSSSDKSLPKDPYKPQKTRGTKELKEGYCEECRRWFKLKTSSYWYHMNFIHGISSKGVKYPEPEFRRNNGKIEGFCETCDKWIVLGNRFNEKTHKFGWYRHCQKVHK